MNSRFINQDTVATVARNTALASTGTLRRVWTDAGWNRVQTLIWTQCYVEQYRAAMPHHYQRDAELAGSKERAGRHH